MEDKNIYFPCSLIEHEDHSFSITCSDFHYFDDVFGEKGGGGYTLEKLAKKIAKENKIKNIKYDSEAGMFCAYSDTSEGLLALCERLKELTGDEDQHISSENTAPLISLDKAEKLLIDGFVKNLNKESQNAFLINVPMPALSKNQAKQLNDIQNGTDEEIIKSAKRINSEARTKTRDWNNFLSHPTTMTIFFEAIDKTENPKVYTELLDAIVFISMRHLPDLRAKTYFLNALKSKTARNRQVGIWGLSNLYDYPFEAIIPLIKDKSYLVRKAVLGTSPEDFSIFYPLFLDSNRHVQIASLEVILNLEEHEIFSGLKDLIPIYNERMESEKNEYIKSNFQEVLERLEKIK